MTAINPVNTAKLSNWLWNPEINIETGFKRKIEPIKRENLFVNIQKIIESTIDKKIITLYLNAS